ncbi:MAG TPA: ATP-binding protein, partial [Spirochaetales bacterium]|nr:ATP-binding protein [Spirochaetales bacterium]
KTVLIRPHRGFGWALGAGLYRDEVIGLIDGLSIIVSLIGTLVALGASLLVARIGKRELFDRVARLDASLTAMASGSYRGIPADGRGDEISRITEAARALAEAVAEREASLAGAAAELERRVEERSGQLLAAEREAMIGRLVAGFAHEINNPLAAIKSVVETARRETGRIAERLGGNRADADGSRAAAALALAELASNLEALGEPVTRIGALLGTLSSLAAGKSAGGEERTALLSSIGDALALLPRAAIARSTVELELDRDLTVRIDPAGARRVWLALATNALQAVDWQGRIAIRAKPLGDRVAVEFEDEGPGVDPGLGDSIFEPFVSSRPRSEGLGLGLALARGIVTEYGGSIAFDSRPGRTVFRVELEVAREP